jgi:lipoic acid synthetase
MAQCVAEVALQAPHCLVETLISDFQGDLTSLRTLLASKPLVVAHNLETVERLTPTVRDRRASYAQSLNLLKTIKMESPSTFTKTSLMLGLGETQAEIHEALQGLQAAAVDVVTLGQYLQPSPKHIAVSNYVHPEEFAYWKQVAEQKYGFLFCASGALVRSSYRAGELFLANVIQDAILKPNTLAPC